MWNPVRLKIKNLLTHIETEYVFQADKAVMISGINLDNINPRSNGSGKTTIGEGLSILITGDSFRQVTASKLVRNGEKFFEVEGEFYNTQTKDTLWLYRKIHSNTTPSQLKILFNGKLPVGVPEATGEDCIDIREGNKYILKLFGTESDDLFNYYMLSKDTYTPFLMSTDGAMKKVIDRFSNAKVIDPVFKLVKQDIESIDVEIIQLDKEKVKSETRIEGWQEEIRIFEKTDFEEEKNKLISQYKEEIEEIEEENSEFESNKKLIFDSESELKKIVKEAKKVVEDLKFDKETVEGAINAFEKEKIEVKLGLKIFEEKITKINSLISKRENQKTLFIDIKSDLYKSIQGSVECPECTHEFCLEHEEFNVVEGKKQFEEVQKDIQDIEKSIILYRTQISEIKNESKKVEEEVKIIQEKITVKESLLKRVKITINNSEQSISTAELNLSSKERQLKILQSTRTENLKRIENIKERIVEEQERQFVDKVPQIQIKIDEELKSILQIEEKVEIKKSDKQSKVEQELKFKKFKTFLANKCVASIEGYTNFFLQKFKTNLQIKMSGYRELKDGTIKEEITCNVLREGVDEGELKKFSGGEKGEIILANIFALQNMINVNSEFGGLNLTWLDEILESVDYAGMVGIYDAVNQFKMCINIISHVKDVGFENEIFVKKENKVSEIVSREEYFKSLELVENE